MSKTTMNRRQALAMGAGAAAIAGFGGAARAQVDLSGKTIEWIIPFGEGGGSASWGGFYAPLLSEALPGNPNVVLRFMPGAGSTKGANYFQEDVQVGDDVIFGTSGSTQFPYLLGDPRVRYEYRDWEVVLASGTGGVAYLPADLGAQFLDDPNSITGTNFVYGSQGATRLDLVPLLAWELLGFNVEPVFGIEGRGDGRLMFERGEANIDYQTSSAYLANVAPLVEAGSAVPMMTWGSLDDDGNIVRDPTFPDVPTFKEVYANMKGEEPSGAGWDAWKAFFISGFAAQKMVFLKGGSDPALIETYENAFRSIFARPDFAEMSAAQLGVYPQLTGAPAKVALEQAISVPAEAKEFVLNWLKDRYGVEIASE